MADQNTGYVRPYNWTNDDAAGLGIDPGKFDADGSQVAAALNNRLRLDGQGPTPSADIPMTGHGFTGLRPGAAAGEAATYDQLQAAVATIATGNAFALTASILGL